MFSFGLFFTRFREVRRFFLYFAILSSISFYLIFRFIFIWGISPLDELGSINWLWIFIIAMLWVLGFSFAFSLLILLGECIFYGFNLKLFKGKKEFIHFFVFLFILNIFLTFALFFSNLSQLWLVFVDIFVVIILIYNRVKHSFNILMYKRYASEQKSSSSKA